MTKSDYPFSSNLPTREGIATGHANERQMASQVDVAGIRTVKRLGADGTETRLRTRAGFPEYVTIKPETKTEAPELYLESGAQTALDDSDNSSVWNLLDLAPPSRYLGWIVADGAQIGMHTHGTLSSGNASLAMVEPERKAVAKKIPASLFSGSMRIFVQAQYGAKGRTELSVSDNAPYGFSSVLDIGDWALGGYDDHIKSVFKRDGSATDMPNKSLIYEDGTTHTQITLGFTAGSSSGIFRYQKKYWVITLERSGAAFTVTAYRIMFPVKVAAILRRISKLRNLDEQTAASRKETRQLMAYAFAYGKIDVDNPVALGSVVADAGYPFAYGWKWNVDGTEARMVVHHTTGGYHDTRWTSREFKLIFGYQDNPFAATEAEKFFVTIENTEHGIWSPRVLSFIYAPGSEVVDLTDETDPMKLHRKAIHDTDFAGTSLPSCSELPIYGFYVDDQWTPVLHTIEVVSQDGYWTETTTCAGVYVDGREPGVPGSPAYDEVVPAFSGTRVGLDTNTNWGAYVKTGTSASGDSTFVPVSGTRQVFVFDGQSVETKAPAFNSYRSRGSASFSNAGGTGGASGIFPQSVWDAVDAFMAAGLAEFLAAETGLVSYWTEFEGDTGLRTSFRERYIRLPEKNDPIALVIPHGDAEAVFLMTADAQDDWVLEIRSDDVNQAGVGVTTGGRLFGVRRYTSVPPHTDVRDELSDLGAFYQTAIIAANTTTAEDVPQTGGETDQSAYLTGKVPPVQCPERPNFEDFWRVDSRFFLAGVFSLSGAGDKCHTSEGISSDEGLQYTDRFCGWV